MSFLSNIFKGKNSGSLSGKTGGINQSGLSGGGQSGMMPSSSVSSPMGGGVKSSWLKDIDFGTVIKTGANLIGTKTGAGSTYTPTSYSGGGGSGGSGGYPPDPSKEGGNSRLIMMIGGGLALVVVIFLIIKLKK